MAMVECKDVTRIYKSGDHVQKALDGATFTLDEGKFVVISWMAAPKLSSTESYSFCIYRR